MGPIKKCGSRVARTGLGVSVSRCHTDTDHTHLNGHKGAAPRSAPSHSHQAQAGPNDVLQYDQSFVYLNNWPKLFYLDGKNI